MEHTKGKVKHKNCGVIRSEERDKHIATCISYCSTNPNFSTDAEANAKEIVRRWNAFEDSGIVEELRKAADEGLHECERVKINCTCEHKDLSGLLRRIERIEAALAKS